ncbi:hypothetical protein ACH5RR_024355 [Cinchona calisaya]|uniref:GBF-interacting protein 1 N-terminal domain-containing protein n=1 Tax=Cinchona calisaya TaxID=153742 RepID=A0ABD2Z1H9_9GENT
MISDSKIDRGTQILSAGVRKTIQSIKEIVGNHSEADIYVALKETNMDPNDAAQKLLFQDPFHEVKRKKDKKKENPGYRSSTAAEPKKNSEYVGQAVKSNMYPDGNVRRIGYARNTSSGVSREFRVVRDNRVNQNSYRESKPVQNSTSSSDPMIANVSVKSSPAGTSVNQRPHFGRHTFQALNGPADSQSRQYKDGNLSVSMKKDLFGERRRTVRNTAQQMQSVKPSDSEIPSTASSSNSVLGVYSSSSDPVHVPSPDSRPAANIGAIKREVGAVGAHRQNSDPSAKLSSPHNSSFSNVQLGREVPSRESRSFGSVPKGDQSSSQSTVTESAAVPVPSVSRSFTNCQYNGRGHQPMGHQKAPQPNKEWKPKSSQKTTVNGPGVIGMPANAASSPVVGSKDVGRKVAQLEDEISCVNVSESQNVIIAAHIRVSETDRCRLTFGSLGSDFEARKSGFLAVASAEGPNTEPSGCLPAFSAPESSSSEPASNKPLDLMDDHARNSGSGSPVSVSVSDHQLNDKNEASSTQNLENYAHIGLVRDNSASYVPPESQQQQDTSELPNFSAYDPQTGYDIPYFEPTIDEHVRGQGLPSPQEVLSSHAANSIPSSPMAMVQQQQQQQQAMAQMYPQLHVSHFANLMPYRQFLSPVYVPPMAVPGYSSNPAYPHPSNGSSYVLMPGTSSHLTANGVKYGIQQFKPVPAGSATGFGNFTSPTGYAVNTPGVVGNATGLEDSSRLKYKDGNLYVPNPQAETSEIWMNPRDLQSASYYNMPGQSPHASYLPSHSSHASYNAAAVAQSSHMQFPGLYHPPPQPATIANPRHLGPAMGANVGVAAAAPGAQVGYQQPQLGHLNWTGNF